MSVDIKARFDREAVSRFSNQMKEPSWILEQRLNALDLAEQLDLPKLEKTKIDKWNLDQFLPFQTEETVSSVGQLPDFVNNLLSDVEGRSVLVQKNASVIYRNFSDELQKQGVIFTDLHTAVKEHGDLVKKYFAKSLKPECHKLNALHYALWGGGVFLYVPKNVEVQVPIQALYWASEGDAGLFPHILLVAEESSSVTYVDNYISSPGENPALHVGIVEVFVGQNAKVRYASVRTLDERLTDFVFRRAVVEKDGQMEWILGEMNNGNTVSNNTSILEGDGSVIDTKVVSIGSGKQKSNLTSHVKHIGMDSASTMVSKGVMMDESTGIFNGITKIEKGATRSNGQQAENILMLSGLARGDANPILLIDEDDVKAGHAASVGQVNPLQLYYLMSRGIERRQAERLIINGFLAPVVHAIPLESVRERLEQAVERKLSK